MIYKPKPAGHPMFRLSPQFLTQFKIRWRCSRRVTGFQHGVTYLLWLIYGTTLVHHLQMLAQRRTNDCAKDPLCYLYFDPSPIIGPQRWFNAGPTLSFRIMNKTLAQDWVNAYNSFHLYINMLFFSLTSRINPSYQTDAVLITANKSKRDDSRAWF